MSTLTAETTVKEVLDLLDQDGYAVVTGVLDPEQVAATRAELQTVLESVPHGRNPFEGFHTRRIYALFAKTRLLDGPATHPLVLGVLDQVLGNYQLSAPTGIEIGPGEKAQALHHDDGVYPLPPGHQQIVRLLDRSTPDVAPLPPSLVCWRAFLCSDCRHRGHRAPPFSPSVQLRMLSGSWSFWKSSTGTQGRNSTPPAQRASKHRRSLRRAPPRT